MHKDMAEAPRDIIHDPVKRLAGTGIKLLAVDKATGQPVNYGVQLNNTTLEIEALPNLKVEVIGFSAMYGALKLYQKHQEGTSGHYCWQCAEAINKALLKADGKS